MSMSLYQYNATRQVSDKYKTISILHSSSLDHAAPCRLPGEPPGGVPSIKNENKMAMAYVHSTRRHEGFELFDQRASPVPGMLRARER